MLPREVSNEILERQTYHSGMMGLLACRPRPPTERHAILAHRQRVAPAPRQHCFVRHLICWKAWAAWSTVPSSQCLPISIIPTGSPLDMPQGTFRAGCPVTSNGLVFGIISRARATYSSRLVLGFAITVTYSHAAARWGPSASFAKRMPRSRRVKVH